MKRMSNEIYSLVDEKFISCFNANQREFMKAFYYAKYCSYCDFIKRSPLTQEEFFTNMHHRRIHIYQLCCPFCESIYHIVHDKKIQKEPGYNYCPHCGKASAAINARNQIFRFVRIYHINRMGLKQLEDEKPDKEKWLLGYDCYQMEVIELASIIEVVFRGYFEALIFIHNAGLSNQYIKKIIRKQTGNDFMNIEKANDNFKKAFEIDIRKHLKQDVWNDLIDIVNLRNMMVHNNGNVDDHFKNTPSYNRCKEHVVNTLYKLEDNDIATYLKSVIDSVNVITSLYYQKYYQLRNNVVANYYFNQDELEKE
ncbi:MAG: hypothetical protein IKH51_03015 [Clostridia bacterium]|nr:hypothetical protein [Clostridia bacterium]